MGQLALGRARARGSAGDLTGALEDAGWARRLLVAPCRAELFEAGLLRGLSDPGAARRAAGMLEACLARHPHAPLVRLELGRALLEAQEPARAVGVLTAAAEEAPTHLPTVRVLAEALVDAGDLEGARTVLVRAESLAPEDAGLWNARGLVLEQLGLLPQAQEAFRQAALAPGARPEYRANHQRVSRARP